MIERLNWTVKDRVQSDQADVPFKLISKLVIFHLVATDSFWYIIFLNQNLAQDCTTQKALDN